MKLNNEFKFESQFELTEKGGFNSIVFDNNNNIWVGGLGTGILTYDGNTWITYNKNNSNIPTNSSTSIFIDKNNIKWITLWEKKGILKIKNHQWTFFNQVDSNLLNHNFWCATVDFDNNLWLGTGWQQSPIKIVKYNGEKWLINNPINDDGKSINGTIRTLFTDFKGNIWSVSSLSKKRTTVGSLLSKYDGNNWQNIEINDVNVIREIEIDKEGNIWILSKNRIIQVVE
jgi:ligand-binding sensor domain-containing protein